VRERLKEPRKGSEIEPEIVCVQGVGAGLTGDGVLFVERSSELLVYRQALGICRRHSESEA